MEGRQVQAGLITAAVLLFVSLGATPLHAQSPGPAFEGPRGDAAVVVGWLRQGAHIPRGSAPDDWGSAAFGAAIGGFYWTEHIKVEVEAGVSSRRRGFSSELLPTAPSVVSYAYYSADLRSRTIAITPLYQFRRNAWVHPFVGLGVDFDWETEHLEARIQSFTRGSQIPIVEYGDVSRSTERRLTARAAMTTGLKIYMSRRAFIRTEVNVAFASTIDRVAWRVGAGVDF